MTQKAEEDLLNQVDDYSNEILPKTTSKTSQQVGILLLSKWHIYSSR